MRGRNRGGSGGGGKSHNPLTRVYESNGPDVKIRGTANHVAEKYIQLARDATASGDPVAAENYYQHAEHYFRLIAAAQEQFRQSQPYQQRPESGESRSDESFDDGDDSQPAYGATEPHSPREQQPYQQREAQPYQQREYQPRHDRNQDRNQDRNFDRNRSRHQQDNRSHDNRPQERQYDDRQAQPANGAEDENVDRLPSFITGAAPAPAADQQNGHDAPGDRFPLNRRRGRRPRTPRADVATEGSDEAAQSGE
ncbi:DUF4167 domain-containing protein [Pseudorhodoplanes sinuspersici]